MRIGITLPNLGSSANPEDIIKAAKQAEGLGYDTLWVADRLLYPVNPKTPYPVTPDGSLPEFYKNALDPLETLTFAAASTSRIGLATGVLDIPFYNPVVLARRLTTLDVLSGGRLRVGFGLGWSEDEFEAAGAQSKERGVRADEFIRVLKAIWTTDPVEFNGKYYKAPKSIIGPKPVQKPHPPIYLAAFVPAALKRAATLANGWLPFGLPLEVMAQTITQFKDMAKEAGRDPAELEVIFGADVHITPEPLGKNRHVLTGSHDQIKEDVKRVRDLGVNELVFTVIPDTGIRHVDTIDKYISIMTDMRCLISS